jgi:hypothetical protein
MRVLAHLGSQWPKFHAAGWTCWFLGPFICSRVSGVMRFREGSDKWIARTEPSCLGLSSVTRAGFTVMTMRQSNNPPNEKFQTHWDPKMRDSWRAKSIAANSASYCDDLRRLCENVRRLRPELWRQKNRLLHHDKTPFLTSFFTREFLTKNNMTVVHHPPYFSVSPIEDKSEKPPFWQKWGDRGRIAGGAVHPYRIRLLGCI